MTSCAFVEWPDGLQPSGPSWDAIRRAVDAAAPDILITDEMPFGPWVARARRLDREAARRSVDEHEGGLAALAGLGVPAVLSSRPVWSEERLANEAFALLGHEVVPLHRKRFFPEEDGWFEATWFEAGRGPPVVREILGVKVGMLLCTDLMFNEQARRLGRQGADLIAVPRAAGTAHRAWSTAGAMAAIVSGSYVISSNRVGSGPGGPTFGGFGFACAPDGTALAATSAAMPIVVVDIDVAASTAQKARYPCYVGERGEPAADGPPRAERA